MISFLVFYVTLLLCSTANQKIEQLTVWHRQAQHRQPGTGRQAQAGTSRHTGKHSGTHAGLQACKQAGWQARHRHKQAGTGTGRGRHKEADRQACSHRQAGRLAGRQEQTNWSP